MRDLTEIEELPTLSDGRLVVRPYRTDDAPAVAAMCHDPSALRWLPLPDPYQLSDAREWIGDAERRWREDRWATFVVADTDTGRMLGSNGLRIDEKREAGEIGYMTHREERCRGVASGGVRLLVAWAFDDLGLGRLEIRADVRNEASRSTIASCDFHHEGILRKYDLIHGERVDDVMYSLLPDDPRPESGRPNGRTR